MKINKNVIQIIIACLVTIPGLWLKVSGIDLSSPPLEAFLSGLAILGASFIVLWACDVVQLDVSQTLAIALVALIAVLPEYAVSMYFTWMAGQHPEGEYAQFPVANMTGANRLLIGVGWATIAFIAYYKFKKTIILHRESATEILFLGMATIYAFVIPIKGTLTWIDACVFFALFVWYMIIASKRPTVDIEFEGPSELIASLPKIPRRVTTWLMFILAASIIVLNAEPFSEGLVQTGRLYGINEFLLVQWLAPIASEAPEFTVAIIFSLRGQSNMALAALLSSKLNQWTLLVGMIPAVFGLSSRQFLNPIPMGSYQLHEILLTAAQSFFGVAVLIDFRLGAKEGILFLVLFIGQFFLSPFADSLAAKGYPINGDWVHITFSAIYIILGLVFLLKDPKRILKLRDGFKVLPTPRSVPIPDAKHHKK
ncbi:MAG: sodium:calcium antiporter [bacterium]|nr:sodium:calcium antiporter [bacterium]